MIPKFRELKSVPLQYSSTLFPHSKTARITYTAPANRFAYIPYVHLVLTRLGKPTVLGTPTVWFEHAGIPTPMTIRTVLFRYWYRKVVLEETVPLDLILQPTQQFILYTSDDSTGGSIRWEMYTSVWEFL